jgi:hypothetical protein
MYDVSWAKSYQEEGGQFLLLLEDDEEVPFLTPVGGPNGMIQVLNGSVYNEDNEEKTFYENILKSNSIEIMKENALQKTRNSDVLLMVGMGLIIILLGSFLLVKRLFS